MFDIFLEKLSGMVKSRLFPVTIIYITLFSILIIRLFSLQIVQGEKYESKFTTKSEQSRAIQGTRGNIYDVKGKLLAYNKVTYSVTLLDTGEVKDGQLLNDMIYKIIQLVEANGDKIDIDFGLLIDENDKITFRDSGNSLLRFKRDVYAKSKVTELTEEQVLASAEEVFDYLRNDKSPNSLKFLISDKYSKQDAYKIMSIRYARYLNNKRYLPITIASNVSEETVAAIKENSGDIPGLDITHETIRAYDNSVAESMAHILGYTGTISDEAWEEMSDEQKAVYTQDDQIGKTGLEADFEEYLHGASGYDKVTLNQSNRIVNVEPGKDPSAGNDLYLSIDSDLQNACYKLLEKEIAGILLQKIHKGTNSTTTIKGKSEIVIPINDVYFALLDNNVINISHFDDEDATELEQTVYNTFVSERKKVFNELKTILSYSNPKKDSELSDAYKEYSSYIYSMLIKADLLTITDEIKEDATYKNYTNGTISLSEFLQNALGKEWIDRTKFSDPEAYYESEEIYNKFIDHILKQLSEDSKFSKMIYEALVWSQKISGRQISLLLFDQNVLKYDQDTVSKLKSGALDSYKFIRSKIESLEIRPGDLALEPCSGSIVLTDSATGKVKALVTYPSYDNNKLANKVDSSYYKLLTENKAYPLINRPLQQKTAPGSTYKMMVSITGLEEHVIAPTTLIQDKGVFEKITPSPKCWFAPHSHGKVNVSTALEVSCNYFFYELAYQLGYRNGSSDDKLILNKLTSYAKAFGLGEVSGIELSSEYNPQISDEQAIRTAIGQGTNNFTPVNLSKYVTGIVNNGTVYNLSIVNTIQDVNGNVIKSYEPSVYENEDNDKNLANVSQQSWNAVKEGMYLVVNGSRSSIDSLFKNLDFKVAGKTGTAQEIKTKPNHALFVSYAPYDNPEITVTTVIPNGYTSSNAAELARNVYRYYFNVDEREALLSGGAKVPQLGQASSQE